MVFTLGVSQANVQGFIHAMGQLHYNKPEVGHDRIAYCSPKTNLFSTVSHLEEAVDQLESIHVFERNGYPLTIVERTMASTLSNSSSKAPLQDRIIIRLPWLGSASVPFKGKLLHLNCSQYPSVHHVLYFHDKEEFPDSESCR